MVPTLWQQYQQLVDLYRYYLDLVVKTSSAFWLIAGGVLAFAFANSTEPNVRWALIVPIVMSSFLIVVLLVGRSMIRELHQALRALSDEIELRQRVHSEILVWAIDGLAGLLVVITILLVWLLAAFPRAAA